MEILEIKDGQEYEVTATRLVGVEQTPIKAQRGSMVTLHFENHGRMNVYVPPEGISELVYVSAPTH